MIEGEINSLYHDLVANELTSIDSSPHEDENFCEGTIIYYDGDNWSKDKYVRDILYPLMDRVCNSPSSVPHIGLLIPLLKDQKAREESGGLVADNKQRFDILRRMSPGTESTGFNDEFMPDSAYVERMARRLIFGSGDAIEDPDSWTSMFRQLGKFFSGAGAKTEGGEEDQDEMVGDNVLDVLSPIIPVHLAFYDSLGL